MKKFVGFILLLGGFLVFGCGSNKSAPATETQSDSAQAKVRAEKKPGRPNKGGSPTANATPVEITPITIGDISSYLLYSATVETEQMAEVYARIPGLIEEIFVEEGQFVKKNQPLLRLEQDEHILQEEKARVQFEQQKNDFARLEKLKDKNLISVEEFEKARLTLRQAELEWKQAKLNLDYTTVRSPINGVIGDRFVKVGDRIQTSTKLFVISNLREKVAKIFVPQNELLKCYQNQPAVIVSDVLPEQTFRGWVKRISPIIDPLSGTFKVTVGIKDPGGQLKPGMFVSVQLIVDTHRNTRLLPKAALIYENERSHFFVVKGDSVERVELKKGFEDAQKVEVLNDLAPGTQVVVLGQAGLRNGSRVRITDNHYYPWQNIPAPQQEASSGKNDSTPKRQRLRKAG